MTIYIYGHRHTHTHIYMEQARQEEHLEDQKSTREANVGAKFYDPEDEKESSKKGLILNRIMGVVYSG